MLKEQQKQKDKELAQVKKAAGQIVAKASPALESIAAMLGRPDITYVSSVLLEPLEKAQQKLSSAIDCANSILSSGSMDEVVSSEMPTLAEIQDTVAAAKKDIALIMGMLARITQRVRG